MAGLGMDTGDRYLRPTEWVVEQLTRRIASGRYAPLEVLPGERALSEELRIGRGSVRLALAEMAEKGLVRRLRGRGTQVVPVSERPAPPRIATLHAEFGDQSPPEGVAVFLGITERLKTLGYASDPIIYTTSPLEPGKRGGSGALRVSVESVPALLEDYDAAVFQEVPPTPVIEQAALDMERRRRPIVVANLEVDYPLSATRVDHRRVFREATEVLLGYGHRRIGFVGRDTKTHFYSHAREAYAETLRSAGLSVDEDLIVLAKAHDSLSGYVASRPLIRSPRRPTAIVAARDALAGGACHAIEEAGLRVGRDVSVISYDNVSWPRPDPFLTTFAEPAYDLGATAVDMLVERITSGWRPVEQRILEARLVLRRSVGLPPLAEEEEREGAVAAPEGVPAIG